MNRRECLAMVATSGMLSGCRGTPDSSSDDGKNATGTIEVLFPEPDGRCGRENEPLSAYISSSGGDSGCQEIPVSFTVENEREEATEVTVTLSSESSIVETYSYVLEPRERVVEQAVAPAPRMDAVSVSIEDEGTEFTGSWEGVTCRRHAVAIVPGDIVVGYVSPAEGNANAHLDCYYGEPRDIQVESKYRTRDVIVGVVDHCSGETRTETVTAGPGRPATLENVLTGGGVYDVVFDVEDGEKTVFEYDEACRGVTANVSADGVPDATITSWGW